MRAMERRTIVDDPHALRRSTRCRRGERCADGYRPVMRPFAGRSGFSGLGRGMRKSEGGESLRRAISTRPTPAFIDVSDERSIAAAVEEISQEACSRSEAR
jgi:hypothetical protein